METQRNNNSNYTLDSEILLQSENDVYRFVNKVFTDTNSLSHTTDSSCENTERVLWMSVLLYLKETSSDHSITLRDFLALITGSCDNNYFPGDESSLDKTFIGFKKAHSDSLAAKTYSVFKSITTRDQISSIIAATARVGQLLG